jgi:hypothetical protein
MKKFLNLKEAAIIAIILIICFLALFIVNSGKNGKYAVISSDGNEILRLELDKDRQNITVANAENIVFEVKDGAIFVTETDCHDKICLKTGAVSKNGQSIVCLPKKITVKIIGEDSEADVTIG